MLAYLALPFDIAPDFIPLAGQFDDAIIVVLLIHRLRRAIARDVVREQWPGPDESLELLPYLLIAFVAECVAVGQDPVSAIRAVRAARDRVPAEVRQLSWLSFWNDAASELAYPLIPIFLTATLGAPVAVVGLVEGLGEAVATTLRAPAGAWSDRVGRKRFVVFGYSLGALTKPLLAVAPAWGFVLALRIADRVGKGVRSAPRDAMISDFTDPADRGTAFGYHRSMDTLGAVVGPLVALGLLASGVPIRWVLAIAAIPALVTLLLLRRLREPARGARSTPVAAESWRARLRLIDRRMWWILAGWIAFSLGNSSDAFLILRSKELGLSTALVVLAYAGYNLVYAFAAWPAGAVSDRLGRRPVLVLGLVVFALVYAGFGLATGAWQVWPLLAFYGLYIAFTDGIVRALISDVAPPERVGAALGVMTAAGGLCTLIASVAAGFLWDRVGSGSVFALGAGCAALGALVFTVAPLAEPGARQATRRRPADAS